MTNINGPLSKVRSDALWNELSPEQRETLAEWLFEERLSYAAALAKARTELGFRGSVSSLRRFYRRAAQERMLAGFAEAAQRVKEIEGAEVDPERLRAAGLKVVAQLFFQQAVEAPERVKDWAPLARMLLRSQENQARVKAKAEEHALRQEKLRFARTRWEYDVARALFELKEDVDKAMKEHEELEVMDVYAENRKLNKIRRRLFGANLPDMAPESAEEEGRQNEEGRS